MKHRLIIPLLLCAASATAQVTLFTAKHLRATSQFTLGDTSVTSLWRVFPPSAPSYDQLVTAKGIYDYFNARFIQIGATASSDLSGTYPSPTVDGLQGRNVAATAPASGEVLKWNGTAWAPGTDNNTGTTYTAGTGIDITGPVITNTLPDVTVNITDGAGIAVTGTYPNFTITNTGDTDASDDLTTATTFSGDVGGLWNNLQLGTGVVGQTEIATDGVGSAEIEADAVGSSEIAAGAVGASELASTAVTPGTYGSASLVPVLDIDADGRITGATTAAVSGGGGTPGGSGTQLQYRVDGTTFGGVSGSSVSGANITLGGQLIITAAGPQVRWIETDASNKSWHIEPSGGNWQLNETAVATRVEIPAGGRMGLSTTPTARLHVRAPSGNADALLCLTEQGGTNAFTFSQNGQIIMTGSAPQLRWVESDFSNKAWHFEVLNGGLTFTETAVADRMRLEAGGNMGLGLASSITARLHIQGGGNTSATNTALFENSSGTDIATIRDDGQIAVYATNTAAGTTGNQTINRPSGTVNFAAGASSLTVTNSLVTTASLVFCTVRTNDTTATIKNVVPASGAFTINLGAAATAETSVGFFVIN